MNNTILPLAITAKDVAGMLSVSGRHVFNLDSIGQLPGSLGLEVGSPARKKRLILSPFSQEGCGVTSKALALATQALDADEASTQEQTVLETEYHRPERFTSCHLNGLTEVDYDANSELTVWRTYVRTRDGRRNAFRAHRELRIDGTHIVFQPPLVMPESLTGSWSAQHRWSPSSRAEWLEGKANPCPKAAFSALVQSINDAVEFAPDAQNSAYVVAAWVMMTYFTPLCTAVPYLHFQGTAGSGKSAVLNLISELAFRPLLTSNITPAALYIQLDELGGTLLIDEAEQFKVNSEIGRLLNAGNSRGATVCRARGYRHTERYSVFGPKALGSINPLNGPLASRCIHIGMLPSSPGARLRSPSAEATARLRDQLHVLAMEQSFDLQEVLASGKAGAVVANRQKDLWEPLLGIAHWLDGHGSTHALEAIESAAKADSRARSENRLSPQGEHLLYALLRFRMRDVRPTPAELLKAASMAAPDEFVGWRPQTVSDELKVYCVPKTEKIGGIRRFIVDADHLKSLIERQGLNPADAIRDPNSQVEPDLAANAV